MNDYVIPHLEWEVMREPITIPKVDDTRELPEGENEIKITRDESYNLQAALFTKSRPNRLTKSIVPYRFAELFEIKGSDSYDRRCTLESCNCVGYNDRVARGRSYKVALSIQGLKIRHQTETEGAWLTEWYINGPRGNFVFHNSTTRKMTKKTILRERLAHNAEQIHSIEVSGEYPYSTSGTSRDYLRIETGDLQFLIAKAPEGIGPNWSSNIGIEYQKDLGRIPNENEREKIRELCSFIFGRQLLIVGHTSYDEDANVVEEYACNPWGNDPRYLCSTPDIPPIRIDGHSRADDLITRLLPPYCKRRDDCHLNHALWLYWLARDMPAGMGLPFLAAAVEAIMDGWFEPKNKNIDMYLFSWDDVPGNDNEKLVKFLVDYHNTGWAKSAETGICKSDDGKTICIYKDENLAEMMINEKRGKLTLKISDCRTHELKVKNLKVKKENGKLNVYKPPGVTKRFKTFFDKNDLVLNDREQDAIDARHGVAHGGFVIASDPEKMRDMILCGFAYETIIHKILLRLLDYSGWYINYSDGCKDKLLEPEHDQEYH
jgi:hypothetical protein